MIVIIDNYDSFTYNLYQAVAVYAQDVIVLRNDAVDASMLQKLKPTALVFSPGQVIPMLPEIWNLSFSSVTGIFPCWESVWGIRP